MQPAHDRPEDASPPNESLPDPSSPILDSDDLPPRPSGGDGHIVTPPSDRRRPPPPGRPMSRAVSSPLLALARQDASPTTDSMSSDSLGLAAETDTDDPVSEHKLIMRAELLRRSIMTRNAQLKQKNEEIESLKAEKEKSQADEAKLSDKVKILEAADKAMVDKLAELRKENGGLLDEMNKANQERDKSQREAREAESKQKLDAKSRKGAEDALQHAEDTMAESEVQSYKKIKTLGKKLLDAEEEIKEYKFRLEQQAKELDDANEKVKKFEDLGAKQVNMSIEHLTRIADLHKQIGEVEEKRDELELELHSKKDFERHEGRSAKLSDLQELLAVLFGCHPDGVDAMTPHLIIVRLQEWRQAWATETPLLSAVSDGSISPTKPFLPSDAEAMEAASAASTKHDSDESDDGDDSTETIAVEPPIDAIDTNGPTTEVQGPDPGPVKHPLSVVETLVEDPPSDVETPTEHPAPVVETLVEDPPSDVETPTEHPASVVETPVENPATVVETPTEHPAPVVETPTEEPAPAVETPASLPVETEITKEVLEIQPPLIAPAETSILASLATSTIVLAFVGLGVFALYCFVRFQIAHTQNQRCSSANSFRAPGYSFHPPSHIDRIPGASEVAAVLGMVLPQPTYRAGVMKG